MDNLTRLNEDEESDRQGAFHVLGTLLFSSLKNPLNYVSGFFENLLGFNPQLAADLVAKTKILPWLLNRIQAKNHDENRGYAAELISILLQNEKENRLELGKQDGVETLLKVLSVRCTSSNYNNSRAVALAISAKRSSGCGRNRVYGQRFRWTLFCIERVFNKKTFCGCRRTRLDDFDDEVGQIPFHSIYTHPLTEKRYRHGLAPLKLWTMYSLEVPLTFRRALSRLLA